MSMTVKAYLKRGENAKAEIRRFVVDESVTSNYEYLSKKIAQVFPSLGNPDNFSLSWTDTEGDQVTFSSDDELMEALGQLNEDIFRVYVKERKRTRRDGNGGQNATDGPAPTPGAEEEAFHPGVICDGCESRIRGPRFKCITCADYDLCKHCEERGLHPEHAFVKFRKPQVGRSHLGGFFNRPGMFRQFGHPGWRRWWAWNQQQQQGGGNPPQSSENQGGAAPGEGSQQQQGGPGGCPMMGGPGTCFPPPPPPPHGPHMPPPPHVFLRDIGATVAEMLDPLGIDVDIDIDHNGERSHCAGEPNACGGRGGRGRRHGKGGKGRRCRDNPWAESKQPEATEQEGKGDGNGPVAKEASQEPSSGAEAKQQQTKADSDKAPAEPMEMGESGNSANGGATKGNVSKGSPSGSDDAEWTMLEGGSSSPAPARSAQGDAPPFKYQNALTQMEAMGFNNDGGWLTSLLLAKEGDIGLVLDAIKIGNQPKFNVNFK